MSLQTISKAVDDKVNELMKKHQQVLEKSVDAVFKKEFFSQYPEIPKAYPSENHDKDLETFKQQHGSAFDRLVQTGDQQLESAEESPYTRKKLGITYAAFSNPETYIQNAQQALKTWKKVSPQARAAILIESLERMKENFFEVAYSTMHTTGQAYMMSFQASGPHAADRALEAVALGYRELTRFPNEVRWDKPVGKDKTANIEKFYIHVPKGVALSIGCSTFPVWNSVPGIYASLITGNPVIVKPHPMSIYPIALVVGYIQQVLKEVELDPHTIQLAPDRPDNLITKTLAEDDAVKIIDFTGSSSFGDYVENLEGKQTFTEKAGVNSVIIDGVKDLKKMGQNMAFSVSLYSGQMCTAPQNFFIPKDGIDGPEGKISYEEAVKALTASIKGLCSHEKAGPAVCGAIQSEATADRAAKADKLGGKVLLESFKIENPDFPDARTASPTVLEVPADKRELFEKEMFGPILFVVPTESTEQSVELAKELASKHGAISCAAYTTNPDAMQMIADEMAESYTSVGFNLYGQVYVNQNAGFSDPHVSGGNPAGNASFTNPEFIVKRFTTVAMKMDAE